MVKIFGFVESWWIFAYLPVVSLVTYLSVVRDKRKAERCEWRTPESTLHLLEFLGGWPGSFLAQRHYRHKISKTRYQISFWVIVVIQQWAAFDYINDWKYGARAADYIGHTKAVQTLVSDHYSIRR